MGAFALECWHRGEGSYGNFGAGRGGAGLRSGQSQRGGRCHHEVTGHGGGGIPRAVTAPFGDVNEL